MADIVDRLRIEGGRDDIAYHTVTILMDAALEIDRVRSALVKVAVVHHVRMAQNGGTVPSGYSCEICDANCDHGEQLQHRTDCPLSVLNT